MAHVINIPVVGLSLGQRFAEFRASVSERMAKARVYRATLSELQTLSNRELADLDIARGDIQGIAMQAAYGN